MWLSSTLCSDLTTQFYPRRLSRWHQESNELGKLAEDPRHALSEVLGPAHSLSSIETKRGAPTARIDRSEGDVLEQRDARAMCLGRPVRLGRSPAKSFCGDELLIAPSLLLRFQIQQCHRSQATLRGRLGRHGRSAALSAEQGRLATGPPNQPLIRQSLILVHTVIFTRVAAVTAGRPVSTRPPLTSPAGSEQTLTQAFPRFGAGRDQQLRELGT